MNSSCRPRRPAFRGATGRDGRRDVSVMCGPPLLLLFVIVLFGGAGANAQDVALKATAPVPISPRDGTRFDGVPGVVMLVVEHATGTFVPAIFDYRFEVYDRARLLDSFLTPSEAAGATCLFAGQLVENTTYRWRVRAEIDGVAGPWSESWTFVTGSLPRGGTLGFTDVTVAAGFTGPPAFPLGGHGTAFADATGDGRPDLYITMNFAEPVADLFFVNHGGGRFMEAGAARGIADFDAGSHGAAWGDLDNDGDFDLFNGTTGGGASNDVFRNDGRGVFRDVTPLSIRSRREATRGVALFDMDRDGDLDIFAVAGWLGSGDPARERNELYRNDGRLRFSPITSGAAYTAPAGQGVTDADFDGDGDVDLIAGNRDGDLVVLRNGGRGNFTLVDPDAIGIMHRAYSGVTMADVDSDGDLDMLLVGLDRSGETVGHLYRNSGSGTFSHVSDFSDIDGYMGGFADLDNDSDLDLVFAGDDRVYLNDGGGRFSPGPLVPVEGISDPRAISFADMDADGDVDFAVGAKRSRNWLIRNDFNRGNWLKIQLRSRQGAVGAFGAKVAVYDSAVAGRSPIATRESRSANGYLGQDDPVLHVGLGARTCVDVMVTFLDGATRVLSGVSSNQTVTIDGSAGGNAPVFVERARGGCRRR